jgi:hypothetical protein
VRELFKDAIDEYWLPAAGFGALVVLASLIALGVGASMHSPETVVIFGSPVNCASVFEGQFTQVGGVARQLSPEVAAAQDKCSEGPARKLLLVAGGLALVLSAAWTGGWLYAYVQLERSEASPARPETRTAAQRAAPNPVATRAVAPGDAPTFDGRPHANGRIPGWYRDTFGGDGFRFYDGDRWTNFTKADA